MSVDTQAVLERARGWAQEYEPGGHDSAALLQSFVDILADAELDLIRVSSWFPTSHPELWGEQVIWSPANGVEAIRRDYSIAETPTYQNTPAEIVYETGKAYRWRLDGPPEELPFDLLREIQAEGAVDYYIAPFPLLFEVGWITYATTKPGGFTDAELAFLDEAMVTFSWKVRAHITEGSLRSLMEIYLGHNAAERVCAGEFKRGTGTTLSAVLWFCDLRNFTSISDRLAPQDVVEILDRYFEAVAAPIEDHGGEILKFIGDAVLAVFPCEADASEPAAAALRAAQGALAGVSAIEDSHLVEAGYSLEIGVALHRGEVMYGNIGGRSRLDFTVIGAAVNEVCRIESLCKPLETPLLIGREVADVLDSRRLKPLGRHAVKGVTESLELFTLPEYA